MGLNPTQEYYTASRVQGLLDWRGGKPNKRSICEGFCRHFDTKKCPKLGNLPKRGCCDEFVINAETPAQAGTLVQADAQIHRMRNARRHLEVEHDPVPQ